MPGLRDLAKQLLNVDMDKIHDSTKDAQVA
jgi:hypothetical protein